MQAEYLPIEDHAAIGNLRSVALVGRDGAIDWCSLPGLESPSIFAAILDHRRGGRFRVSPADAGLGSQAYIPRTNVLETSFDQGAGRLVITDCMPLKGTLDGVGRSTADPSVHRLLRAEGDDVEVEVEWSPRFQYGNGPPQMTAIDGGFLAWAGDDALTLRGVREDEATLTVEDGATRLHARFTLPAGQRRALVTRWGASLASNGLDDTCMGGASKRSIVTGWRAYFGRTRSAGCSYTTRQNPTLAGDGGRAATGMR